MQEIAFEIDAQRVGRASGYLGGLTIERYTFTGADLPTGTRLAILTRAGGLIAAATIAEGNAAEVDTNTQEVADLLRYQPLGACENVYITLGDADNILAIIPATMRKNWLDDEATHPPVPANRYPTKTELDQWLARFDERATATAAAQSAAEDAATSARASATGAEQSATAAGDSAIDAEDSATAADGSKRAAETAQGKAEAAKTAAEAAQGAAQSAATSAGESAKVASASEQAALSAKQAAETAQVQAKASETAAKASEASAKASETAASASEEEARVSEQAAAGSATAAAGSASAAKASETAAAESATSASASATAAKASANAASSSATAASKSAAAAASSASAAKQSETDLAEAVATAEGLDVRIGAIEGGYGLYKIKRSDVVSNSRPNSNDVDKVLFFDKAESGESDITSTLAVINRALFANKVSPAQQFLEGYGSVSVASCYDYARNKRYICLATTPGTTQIAYVYEVNAGAYSNTFTFKCKVSGSHSSGSGYSDSFTNALFGSAYCVHDGFVFYVHRHHRSGPWLSIHDVETGTLVSRLDLDPVGSGTYLSCGVWFNPSTGHICAYSSAHSLSTGEAWGNGFIRVFNWDSETKTLADIPNGDSPVTMVDFRQALIDAGSTNTNYEFKYLNKWEIRDEVFLAGKTETMADMVLFRVTEDDGIEPCYEWDVEYEADEKGVTRPVWETQEETWTDAEGNTQTIQNYVRNSKWDFSILPKMTKGRMMKFMRKADYDGVPSGTWSANPVFSQSAYSHYLSSEAYLGEGVSNNRNCPTAILLTDGVVRWILLGGHKFVRQEAFNTSIHLDKATRGTDGKFVLKDVRKGAARTFSGWMPTANQYIASAGAQTGGGTDAYNTNITLLVSLTAAQSGTALSRLGMVKNVGVDNAAMTPMPFNGVYEAGNWVFPALPYSTFGFFGRLWATTYGKTYRGAI